MSQPPLATPWNDDPPAYEAVIEDNIQHLIPRLQQQARNRVQASVALAQDWHRAIYAGVPLPIDYYAGEIRDSDPQFPELINYEVRVGSHRGVPAARVPIQLRLFEDAVQRTTASLDAAIEQGLGRNDRVTYSLSCVSGHPSR